MSYNQQKILRDFGDTEIEMEIGARKNKRSIQQNRWYWGVAIPIIIDGIKEQTGEKYTKEDIHEFILNNVIKPRVVTKEVLGETIIVHKVKRTSDMTTDEFSDFKEKLQKFWAERHIDVPDLNENIEIYL